MCYESFQHDKNKRANIPPGIGPLTSFSPLREQRFASQWGFNENGPL